MMTILRIREIVVLIYLIAFLTHFQFVGTESIEKPILNNLLGRHLTNSLCRTLKNCAIFKDADIDMEKILMVSSL